MPTVKLQSSEGEIFIVDVEVACCSETIKTMLDLLGIEESPEKDLIPLANVNSEILQKVLAWAHHHKDDPTLTENLDERKKDISSWDAEFLKVDRSVLFELILAANYLEIKGLMDLTCKAVANMIMSKTPNEIKKSFNIKHDFRATEEEASLQENDSALEDEAPVRRNNDGSSITLAKLCYDALSWL